MTSQIHKKLLRTQPHHESMHSDSQSTPRNKSEVLLKCLPRSKNASEGIKFGMISRSASKNTHETLQEESCRNRVLEIAKMRRKYREAHNSHLKTKHEPQLRSPFIGLKVRRREQEDFDFHSSFTRDEVLNYFSKPPCATIKKKGVQPAIAEFRRESKPKVELKVKHALRVPSKENERISSQLSGWKAESDCFKQSSVMDEQSYQVISNYPSINVGYTHQITYSTPVSRENSSRNSTQMGDCVDGGFQLPEYSLKIVPPSQMNSSAKEMISIKVINENLPSHSLMRNSNSYAEIYSKLTVNSHNQSELKLNSLKHSINRSKKTYQSLPTNKENQCFREKTEKSQSSMAPSDPSEKIVPAMSNKALMRGIMDSGKISVSYSDDYVCSQKLDENDGLRVTEREEKIAFRFQRSNKPIPTPPPVTPPPAVSMKKEKERKSIVIEKIQQFGSNCKNFFSSLADRINPFKEQKIIEEESDITESILALRTLNSRVDLDSHFSPREFRVQIRDTTLVDTQGWGMESLVAQQRMTTAHEIRGTHKDFASEVRIALTNNTQRESFYSQEYLKMQGDQTIRQALQITTHATKKIIAQETGRAIEDNTDCLLDMLFPGKECIQKEIKNEVAYSLQLLESRIMQDMLFAH